MIAVKTMNYYTRLAFLFLAFFTCAWCNNDFTTVLDECVKCAQASDLWACLKDRSTRITSAIVAYQGDIPLMGTYLAVVPMDGQSHEEGRSTTGGTGTKSPSVFSKILGFAEKRYLRVMLPMNLVAWLFSATGFEGRKKNKGGGALMLGGMMMITTLLSTAFGALAMMAGKGLLTSMLALMLSAMAVSKKSGGHGHARTTYEVINGPQGYHQAANYKLEDAAVISDVS